MLVYLICVALCDPVAVWIQIKKWRWASHESSSTLEHCSFQAMPWSCQKQVSFSWLVFNSKFNVNGFKLHDRFPSRLFQAFIHAKYIFNKYNRPPRIFNNHIEFLAKLYSHDSSDSRFFFLLVNWTEVLCFLSQFWLG